MWEVLQNQQNHKPHTNPNLHAQACCSKMASNSFAWLSVTIKNCQEKAREIVQCPWDSTIGSLLAKIDLKLEEETISHINISKTGNFHDPHVVPPVAPVSVCEQFNCMHVCIFLRRHGVVRTPSPLLLLEQWLLC